MSKESDLERYSAAMHAVQSGVAMEMNFDKGSTEPKHLRVGINSAMVYEAALARLLIEKGLITEEEHVKAMADEAEREKARYESNLSQRFGRKITLA